ncbi:hypothetical protein C8F01DRAFT_1182775 [Mycena amicta]|nr:hypothetical protein C8F01DRAFT_1182775 [Mycena amicta]
MTTLHDQPSSPKDKPQAPRTTPTTFKIRADQARALRLPSPSTPINAQHSSAAAARPSLLARIPSMPSTSRIAATSSDGSSMWTIECDGIIGTLTLLVQYFCTSADTPLALSAQPHRPTPTDVLADGCDEFGLCCHQVRRQRAPITGSLICHCRRVLGVTSSGAATSWWGC